MPYPICRHIKTSGLRCQSPALAGEDLCYYHSRVHRDHPAPLTAQKIVDTWEEGIAEGMITGGDDPMQIARAFPRQNEFNFPPLEDAESIQLAASMLFHAIAQGKVHMRRARTLLDILRVASNACRRVASAPDTDSIVCSFDQANGVHLAPADNPAPAPAALQIERLPPLDLAAIARWPPATASE